MKSYFHWTSLADRWAKCVDFGSPVSAWSPAMLKAYREANGDLKLARELLAASKQRGADHEI